MEQHKPMPDLPLSMMAFKLKDGNMIFISKEDCELIATSITTNGLINAQMVVTDFLEKKAELAIGIKQIQAIIEKYPDMNKNKKDECIDLMVKLIKKHVEQ